MTLGRVCRVRLPVFVMKYSWGFRTGKRFKAQLGLLCLFYAFSLYRYINEYTRIYTYRYFLEDL